MCMAEVCVTVSLQPETTLKQLLVQAELHIRPNDNTVTLCGIFYLMPKQWAFFCGANLVPVFSEMRKHMFFSQVMNNLCAHIYSVMIYCCCWWKGQWGTLVKAFPFRLLQHFTCGITKYLTVTFVLWDLRTADAWLKRNWWCWNQFRFLFHKSNVFKLWKWALVNVLIYSFHVACLFFAFGTVVSTLLISFTAAQTKQEAL